MREPRRKREKAEGRKGRPTKMPVVATKGPRETSDGHQALRFLHKITTEREEEKKRKKRKVVERLLEGLWLATT